MISQCLLPIYEASLDEDDLYYKSIECADSTILIYAELFEMKNFIVTKLIDLTQWCNQETNMIKIVEIFEKVIFLGKQT